jgi:hypothetical protein
MKKLTAIESKEGHESQLQSGQSIRVANLGQTHTKLDEASSSRLVVRPLHIGERENEQSELLCAFLKISDLESRLDTACRETVSHGQSAMEGEHDTFAALNDVRWHLRVVDNAVFTVALGWAIILSVDFLRLYM